MKGKKKLSNLAAVKAYWRKAMKTAKTEARRDKAAMQLTMLLNISLKAKQKKKYREFLESGKKNRKPGSHVPIGKKEAKRAAAMKAAGVEEASNESGNGNSWANLVGGKKAA